MFVSSVDYQVFYEALRREFIKKEYGGIIPAKARKISSPIIWDKQDEQKRYISLLRFAEGATQDPRYFYRLHGKFKIGRVIGGEVNDLALKNALKYIGVNLVTDNEQGGVYPLFQEVKLLFDKFIRQTKLDKKAGENKGGQMYVVVSEQDAHVEEDLKKVGHLPDLSTTEKYNSARLTIRSFFTHISLRRFEEAWRLLSFAIRHRVYDDDYKRFELAYHNTRAVRYLSIADMNETADTKIDCIITYEDEIDAYTSTELDSFNSMTVKNLEEFVEFVRRIEQDVIKYGGEGFEKIELYKFFEPAASESIWYSCHIDPDKLSELFSRRRTVFVKRTYSCSCNFIDGQWFLERVTSIPIATLK